MSAAVGLDPDAIPTMLLKQPQDDQLGKERFSAVIEHGLSPAIEIRRGPAPRLEFGMTHGKADSDAARQIERHFLSPRVQLCREGHAVTAVGALAWAAPKWAAPNRAASMPSKERFMPYGPELQSDGTVVETC
jgi:hypothetical protein